MVQIIDVRVPGRLPTYTTGSKKGKVRAYRGRRDPGDIDRLCVHHLGPHLSAEPRARQTYEERAVQRARAQPYHVWVQPGIIVLMWDFLVATWHGNGTNRRSVGLVVAGRFPALADCYDPKVHDRAEDYIESLDAAMARVAAELPGIRLVVTHSQYSAKPADPGESIARAAARIGGALGLNTAPDLSAGTGSPWPAQWRRP